MFGTSVTVDLAGVSAGEEWNCTAVSLAWLLPLLGTTIARLNIQSRSCRVGRIRVSSEV